MKTSSSPYMKLNRIEFMVTFQCTGSCKHCSVAPFLNQGSVPQIQTDNAIRAVEALSRLFEITSVMTFGGEPLLYPDAVCAIHHKAAECGINTRQVITNGYFTKDAIRCRDVALALERAGVNNLLLSVDAFHQESIPKEAVFDFAKNVRDSGLPTVKLHPSWVVNEAHENPWNAKTRDILAFFSELALPVSSGNDIILSGNAEKYLAQYYAPQELNLSTVCGTIPYTDPLTEIETLSVVPNGDVMVCGFVIGNINTEDAAEIAARYDPFSNAAMRAVAKGGLPALITYAESMGLRVDPSRFHSACDLCRSIAVRL